MKLNHLFFVALVTASIVSCDPVENKQQLPVYGNPVITEKIQDGKVTYDTAAHQIGYFRLFNQDSTIVTPESLNGKVYVADFFFTSCITLCPKMKTQMLRLYNEFQDNEAVALVSHSIDPTFDTVNVLRNYAKQLNVSSKTWHFLTGDKEDIYNLAYKSYMTERPADDPADKSNILHSGAFILVDTQRRVRGVYDGTVPEQVELLMKDIRKLINEDNENS